MTLQLKLVHVKNKFKKIIEELLSSRSAIIMNYCRGVPTAVIAIYIEHYRARQVLLKL